ncbi:MarR family transcriptional regulator [Tabrizicola sp.]|uniref:MarR family transcriptional regulator n=1 Tax=Tabrizicola sp. TaxID=2005166 RepID=UPI003F3B545E
MDDATDRLQKAITAIMRALKVAEPALQKSHGALKLAPSDIQALQVIASHPGAMSGTLAQHLGIVPTTATSIVDRLVRRGLVRRERRETNRRAVALWLTPAGEVAVARLSEEERAASRAMLDALEPEEHETIVSAMERVAAHLNRLVDQTITKP